MRNDTAYYFTYLRLGRGWGNFRIDFKFSIDTSSLPESVATWYEEIFSSVQHMLMLLISYLPNWYLDKTKQYRVIRPPPRGVNHYIISILITPDLNKDLWISVRLSRYSCFLHQDEEKPNDVQIEFKKQRKKLRFSLFFGTMNKYIELTKSCLD